MMRDDKCAIWQTPAKISDPDASDATTTDSPRAGGQYQISGTATVVLQRWSDQEKVLLTSWLVEQRRLGVSCPEISSTVLRDVRQRRPPSVLERADNLLRCLEARSPLIGTPVNIYLLDNSRVQELADQLLAWTGSQDISEVITLAEYCAAEHWIRHQSQERVVASSNTIHQLMLMPPGYARIAALDGTNSKSKQGFVAMWFDLSMKEAYEHGIHPAIVDAGYEAMRIDGKDHNNKIDDEIIAEIRRSRFMVADFTQGEVGARGGVYYEAGFAHGLNMPVIFCCRKDAIEKVHFDTRQYNHIVWEKPQELRDALSRRISATIGDGPNKKS